MRHRQTNRRRDRLACVAIRAAGWMLWIATWLAATTSHAQDAPAVTAPVIPVSVAPPAELAPGTAIVAPDRAAPESTAPGIAVLDPEVQVVRFQGPPGLVAEVLAPAPTPVSIGDGGGIITVGLKRGVGYRLRLTNIPERPGAELFPVIEVVGHLHRPNGIDPGKYPIRVVFNQDDLDDTVDRARLVTKVIYLEDPDQAIPFRVPKDQVFVHTLNPSEPPLTVATALGRPVAIVRIGVRTPSIEEINAGGAGDLALDWASNLGMKPCPFLCQSGARCGLPCGPVCVASTPTAGPSLPRDEYLCDGGDRGIAAVSGTDGRVSGIEPRDAVVRFDIGLGDRSQPRVLPTNVVCVYAPRFAEVRVSSGTHQNVDIQTSKTDKVIEKYSQASTAAVAKRLVQNQAAELARSRARASGLNGKVRPGADSNNRAAAGYTNEVMVASNLQKQTAELARNRQKPTQLKEKIRVVGIKTAEGPIVTAIAEGVNEAVRVWGPQDMTGIETPPNRPGLAVIKRVSANEAEPGDTLTYVIIYRNMGNTPIRAVAIVDSLLPRLEYVKGTSRGVDGTTFTTALNRLGSIELRWQLPCVLKPGETGHVSFQAIVR
jgi:uncharacterized repeat protein (TIGR01451 family)